MKPPCGPGARLSRVVEGFPIVTQRGDTSLCVNPRLHVLAHEPALNMCQHSLDKPVSDMEATRTYSQMYKSWLVQPPRGGHLRMSFQRVSSRLPQPQGHCPCQPHHTRIH